MKNVEIYKENVISAYKEAKESGKLVVMERIKTFDDAYNALGKGHPLVKEYDRFLWNATFNLVDYMRLCIICAALNEGWEPQFEIEEHRFFPWFRLYAKEEVDRMSEEQRKELCLCGGNANHGAMFGLGFVYSNHAFSIAGANVGSRLALRSKELAEYCGKQFIDIWKDYLLGK